ncbi:MAG: LCP family protein [Clostridia bacterium]|nr:LCP family protein [Clostridia bacterium]
MDNTERRELSRNVRSIRDSMPRNYVERGVCRHEISGRNAESDGIEYQPKAVSDYRSDRLREEKEKREAAMDAAPKPDGKFHPNGATYGSDGKEHSASARRFQRRTSSRPARQLAPDEEPPLLDTFREAAERRKQSKRDFEERYEHSKNGASRVEHIREKDRGGTVIRDVEYYVPKLSGDGSEEINNSKRGKKKGRNRKPMKMWQKASVTALCLFIAFLMSLGVGVSALLNRMNFVDSKETAARSAGSKIDAQADAAAAAEMDGVDDTEIELPDTPIMFDSDIENILLIGSDRRTMSEEGRSDAMMMLTIDRKHKKLKMVSFLRDLYIKIPGKYGTKLNSAYSVGGVDLLKKTLTANLGINVDKYIIVDFKAFKTVVNKIGKINGKGGIKITVTSAEARYMCSHEKYGLFPRFSKGKGTYYMNGAEALNYARIRKIDSDFGRTKRQRKVLTEIMTELKDVSKVDLLSIAYACLEYVTTDFSKGELVGLVTEAAEIANYETKQISIPIKGSYTVQKMSNGNEALAANLSVNSDKLIKFIYDDDMTYEGNEKEIHGIYLPNLKGIANSKLTTRKETTTTKAGDGDTGSTTAKDSQNSTTAKGDTGSTTAKSTKSTNSTKSTTKATTKAG